MGAGLLAGVETLWKGSTLVSFMKNRIQGKESCWRSLWRTVSCGKGYDQGKTVRCLPLAERGAAETVCDELITAGEE